MCRVEQQTYRVDMGPDNAKASAGGVRCLFSKTSDLLFVLLPREVLSLVSRPLSMSLVYFLDLSTVHSFFMHQWQMLFAEQSHVASGSEAPLEAKIAMSPM